MKPDDKEIEELRQFIGNKPITGGLPFCFFDELELYGGQHESQPSGPRVVPPWDGQRDWPAFTELLAKAHQGDENALLLLVSGVRGLCRELGLLARKDPTFVRRIACMFHDFPLVCSPKDAGKNAVLTKFLASLGVGGDSAFIPAYAAQRHDPDNLWTRYAFAALQCLRINQRLVPELIKQSAGAKRKFVARVRHLATLHQTTYFDLGDKILVLCDWQRDCVNLPETLTKSNAPKFMAPAKLAIREFWWHDQRHFDRVKDKAATLVRHNAVGECIDRALDRIGRAMIALGHK